MRTFHQPTIPAARLLAAGRAPRRRARVRAFSLIELMIAVSIIGNLALLALPAFDKIMTQVRGNALLNDLRVFASAFTQYAHVNGSYPATDTSGATVSRTMNGFITAAQWTRETPIGGSYAFLRDTYVDRQLYRALIRVSGTSTSASAGTPLSTTVVRTSAEVRDSRGTTTSPIKLTSAQLQRIDARGDDGNLSGGVLFTSGAALTTYYVVEK